LDGRFELASIDATGRYGYVKPDWLFIVMKTIIWRTLFQRWNLADRVEVEGVPKQDKTGLLLNPKVNSSFKRKHQSQVVQPLKLRTPTDFGQA